MSAEEFVQWIEFDKVSPIGAIRADLRAAIIAQTIANCHIGKNQRPFKRTDFMPFYEEPRATDEDIGNAFIAWGKKVKAQLEQRKKRNAGKRRRSAD